MTAGFSLRTGTVLALSALLGLPVGVASAQAPASPTPRRAAVVVELCAKAGSMTLPGAGSVPIWGYVAGDCAGSPTLTKPGGPTLSFDEGDAVTIRLHNGLSVATGLMFPSLPLQSDRTGTPAGGTKDYTFTAVAGTHLYESALLPNAQYQVAMGLYGAIDVLPAGGGAAYGDPLSTQDSSFDTEATLVLSEIDPALNKSANPANFDLRTFVPRFGLINGVTHPNTAPIPAAAGDRVLLRYVNAGLKLHSMTALGVDQTIVADDAKQLRYPRTIVAETFGPGQTADVIVSVPATAAAGSKYALYDASLTFHNGQGGGTGGMLTFVAVAGTGTPATTPTATSVSAAPNPSNGTAAVTVTATVAASSGAVDAAELYIDSTSSTPIAMTGAFPGASVAVSATISTSVLATLGSGTHVVYVRGHNAAGWGAVASTGLVLDTTGPATGNLQLTPATSRSAGTVKLTASGNETATGGSNVTGGAYSIDGGASQPMSVTGPVSTVTSLTATIPVGTLGLSDGAHVVSVTSTDALGNVGAAATITLTIDNAGPVAQVNTTTATPSPNNGTIGVNSGVPAVRVRSTFTDALSTVAGAEGFIDVVGASGTGFVFSPSDGVWGGSSTDAVFADIPLATIAALSNGNHTIHVHAKDAAGNWGPTATATLVIDKQGPTVSALSVTPPAANAQSVVVAATANDGATGGLNIGGGELFVDTAGANGTGIAMSAAGAAPSTTISGTIPAATVAALSVGTHTIRVHGKDAVGNWGPLVDVTLLIDRTAPTFSSITVTPSSVLAGTASVALTVNGASDTGGAGVAGGEWWIGTTNITPGTGTAFTGTTASIPTAALAAGQYTVRVRIRDGAGNWSTSPNNGVRTATLTVYTDAIFANGFETGTAPWGWTSRSTTTASRLNVTTTTPLVGTRSLVAQGNNTNYVQYDFPPAVPSASTYDARFSFRPNGNASTGSDIFAAGNGSFGTTVFHVRYRLNAGQAQVQVQVGTTANATWVNITNAAHTIQVVWQAAGSGGPNPGTLVLYVDGVSSQTLTHTNTNAVSSVRLGSVTSGGSSTSMSFDAFASKRSVAPLLP